MTTYGDKQEPGVVTTLTSSAAVSTDGEAPNDPGLVGQADLANATEPADTSKVYQIANASKAVAYFGPQESSMLTTAVIDVLTEGAFPVYASVAPSTSVSDEDHSGAGTTTVDLNEAPIREDVDSIDVSLDSTTLTPELVHDDVADYSPADDEVVVNPVRGTLEVPAVPSSSLTASYEHFDYQAGIDVMTTEVPDVIDFLAPISENGAVVDAANVAVGNMEEQYDLVLLTAGADIHLDPTSFSPSYDDSRTQVVYPTRFADGSSAIAAYAGLKANLGLSNTPINMRFDTNKRLAITLNRAERGSLIDEHVVPLANESTGVRIVDDPTTVTESNTDENSIRFGFNRVAADYMISTTHKNQQPFIGKLNSQTVRNTLEGMVSDSLTELQSSNVVESFNVNVLEEDAVSAGLEMSVELPDPLRFIDNTVTIE